LQQAGHPELEGGPVEGDRGRPGQRLQ
jgi:hypothetical protein